MITQPTVSAELGIVYKHIRSGFHTLLIGEPFSSVTGISVNQKMKLRYSKYTCILIFNTTQTTLDN